MDDKLRKLPDGQWEYLVDEEAGLVVVASSEEEAERMAEAYKKGDRSLARKRVARRGADKARSKLVNGD